MTQSRQSSVTMHCDKGVGHARASVTLCCVGYVWGMGYDGVSLCGTALGSWLMLAVMGWDLSSLPWVSLSGMA